MKRLWSRIVRRLAARHIASVLSCAYVSRMIDNRRLHALSKAFAMDTTTVCEWYAVEQMLDSEECRYRADDERARTVFRNAEVQP